MAQHATRSRTLLAVLLRGLLAVALIAPAGLLFAQVWGSVGDRERFARLERHGIEYLDTLGQLTIALTDAQSAAVAGKPFPREAITRAVEATGAVDTRIGDDLRTHERWSGLRAKVEALASLGIADPAAAYSAYGEATDLLLALYTEVRDNSQLIREQDADAYYLEDGAAEELPEAVVAAGRFADLAVITAGRGRGDLATATAALLNARDAVTGPADDLAGDLQAAIDGTSSRTLSGSLLSRLDRFRRSMEALTATTVPLDGKTAVDTTALNTARAEVQSAASDLETIILQELAVLIDARIDDLGGQQGIAMGTLGAAALLAFVPLLALFVRPRRRPSAAPPVPPPALEVVAREPMPALNHRERAGAR